MFRRIACVDRTKNGLARTPRADETSAMRTYGQYCPIARAAEILAERWTPIILRNLLLGATTFTEVAEGAPGIPRTLLTSRLRELERAGVVTRGTLAGKRGPTYGLTKAGRDLHGVMLALGSWGERWMELAPQHLDPGVVLNSWVRWYLARDVLPERRVTVRFDFPDRPKKAEQLWIVFDGERTEVCRTNPGVRRGPSRDGGLGRSRRVAPRARGVGRGASNQQDQRGGSSDTCTRPADMESAQRLGSH